MNTSKLILLSTLLFFFSCTPGDDKEVWRSMDKTEALDEIRAEIAADPKLQRQIGRYAERDSLAVDTAMNMVLERMYDRKAN